MKSRLFVSVVCGAVLTAVLFSFYKLLTKPKKQPGASAPVDNKKFNATLTFAAGVGWAEQKELSKAAFDKEIAGLKRKADHITKKNDVRHEGDAIIVDLFNITKKEIDTLGIALGIQYSVQFRELYGLHEITGAVHRIDELQTQQLAQLDRQYIPDTKSDTDRLSALNPAIKSDAELEDLKKETILIRFAIPDYVPTRNDYPAEIGFVKGKDTAKVKALLRDSSLTRFLPPDIEFAFARNPDYSGKRFGLYGFKQRGGDAILLNESYIETARSDYNQLGDPTIELQFNSAGSKLWEHLTERNVMRCIAIVIDGKVVIAPRVLSKIDDGRVSLAGKYTELQTKAIALQLDGGHLLFPLNLKSVKYDPVAETFFRKYQDYIIIILLMAVLSVAAYFILPLIYPQFELKKGP